MSFHTFKQVKKYKVKITSRKDTEIGTGSEQWYMNKSSTKAISKIKVKDRR